MNNDLCVIQLKTERTTNIATNETSQLLHIASDSLPRFKVYTCRKDSIIGHLILSRDCVESIVKAMETAKKHDYDQIHITDSNSPGLSVVLDAENGWVEAYTDYERQPVKHLRRISLEVRQATVLLAVEGEFYLEDSDTDCCVRFSWDVTEAIRDWLRRSNTPVDIYSDEEFKHLQDDE